MDLNLEDQVAIVTGGGRGIGREISLELAKHGVKVVVTSRTQEQVQSVVEQINDLGGQALGASLDISNEQDVKQLVKLTEDAFGTPEILVNNAGVRGPVGFIQNVELKEFSDVININLLGTFLCVKYILPGMIDLKKGRVINFSGGGAWTGIRGGGAYGASKSAVEGFTRTVALEGARFGITANAIQPGRVATASFPILDKEKNAGNYEVGPENAARCIAWLCSSEASDITGLTINAVEWNRLVEKGESPQFALKTSS